MAPGHKQQEEVLDSIREEIMKTQVLAEKGDLEQLLNAAFDDQEKQEQQERGSEGPCATDTEDENDRVSPCLCLHSGCNCGQTGGTILRSLSPGDRPRCLEETQEGARQGQFLVRRCSSKW